MEPTVDDAMELHAETLTKNGLGADDFMTLAVGGDGRFSLSLIDPQVDGWRRPLTPLKNELVCVDLLLPPYSDEQRIGLWLERHWTPDDALAAWSKYVPDEDMRGFLERVIEDVMVTHMHELWSNLLYDSRECILPN